MKKKQVESMIVIGERVKEVRGALRLQQKEMAGGLKISASYLSEIESAHAKPAPDFFIKFSKTYNVSLEYLLLGREPMFYDQNQNTQTLPEKEYTYKKDIDSIEELVWLMKQSPMFKNIILSYAAQIIMDKELYIRKSLERTKESESEESE